MARCKICGRTVRVGDVMHKACREERVAEIMQIMCDDYCKHVVFSADDEELNEECEKCKIAKLLGYKALE